VYARPGPLHAGQLHVVTSCGLGSKYPGWSRRRGRSGEPIVGIEKPWRRPSRTAGLHGTDLEGAADIDGVPGTSGFAAIDVDPGSGRAKLSIFSTNWSWTHGPGPQGQALGQSAIFQLSEGRVVSSWPQRPAFEGAAVAGDAGQRDQRLLGSVVG